MNQFGFSFINRRSLGRISSTKLCTNIFLDYLKGYVCLIGPSSSYTFETGFAVVQENTIKSKNIPSIGSFTLCLPDEYTTC